MPPRVKHHGTQVRSVLHRETQPLGAVHYGAQWFKNQFYAFQSLE